MEEEDSKTKSSASQGSQKSVGMGPSLQANEGDIESGSSSRLTPEGLLDSVNNCK